MKTKSGITIPDDFAPFIAEDDGASRSPLQKIFLLAGDEVLGDTSLHLSNEQRALILDMSRCRTVECGFNLEACEECGCKRLHYNSCGNRNCSICGALSRELWIDRRSAEVIDAPYYHAVFTCPHELNPLFLSNRSALFSLFHRCVGQSVVELARDGKYLGATPGVIQVLHTWNQELLFHPHVHVVISGGGLTDGHRLKTLERNSFFIPESVMSSLFRGKFMAGLEKLYQSGEIVLPSGMAGLRDGHAWAAFRDSLYRKKWVAHVKETFNGRGNAIEYLGRYANKVAITGSRIVSVSDSEVVFTVRGEDGRQSERKTLAPAEFVRRFVLHVLPKGFQKIRYYGYLSNGTRRKNMILIFNLQGSRKYIQGCKDASKSEILLSKWNIDVTACPHCRARAMITIYSTGRYSTVVRKLE